MIKISNTLLVQPFTGQLQQAVDVCLEGGQVIDVRPHGESGPEAERITREIDGQGKWLLPSFVDLCARLREPGFQQHGTLKSEGQAARHNGFLHVVTPPDTHPVLESGSLIPGLRQRAMQDGGIFLHIIGALTRGLEGQQPANMAGLKQGGCIAVSNAYAPFASDEVILRALEYAASLDLPVFFYPFEQALAKDGCAHDGFMATRQGLAPIPAIAETAALAKLLQLSEETGVRAHFGLLSAGDSVALIRQAKQRGQPVTASVALHQLLLTDQLTDGFNAMAHVMPPLREERDRLALIGGVRDGTIDAICSHHEPLSSSAKLAPFPESVPGISGYDTFAAMLVQFIRDNGLELLDVMRCLTVNPVNIAGIASRYNASPGWFLLDPAQRWQVLPENMRSNGKNTPYGGQWLEGKVSEVFFPELGASHEPG